MFGKKSKSAENPKFVNPKDIEINNALNLAYNAMKEKGYEPMNQLSGYLMSEDPCYVTPHNNARKTLTSLDREEIIKHILRFYFEN